MDKIYHVKLAELKDLAKKKERSTKELFKKLKRKPPKNLDKIVHQIHHDIFDIDACLDCANCCKELGPRLSYADIERMAKHLKIKISIFNKKYIKIDEDNDYVFNQMPCPFLDNDNYCLVYENRPRACREYPHTDRKKIHQILDLTLKNTCTCPAVYRLVENLKSIFT